MASGNACMMDGNLSMAPSGFRQLYIIQEPLGNTAVSTVVALLQTNSQDMYEILLQAVVDTWDEIGLNPDPTTLLILKRK